MTLRADAGVAFQNGIRPHRRIRPDVNRPQQQPAVFDPGILKIDRVANAHAIPYCQ